MCSHEVSCSGTSNVARFQRRTPSQSPTGIVGLGVAVSMANGSAIGMGHRQCYRIGYRQGQRAIGVAIGKGKDKAKGGRIAKVPVDVGFARKCDFEIRWVAWKLYYGPIELLHGYAANEA